METTLTTTATLQDVKDYLLSIQDGVFEPEDYLEAWLTPSVCTYFIEHAVEVVPKRIQWGIGKPFQCHMNTLTYAAAHDGATPWFGMQYLQWADAMGGESAASWELHSWVVEADGSIVDSGEYVPEVTRYIGVKWSWELFDLMKRTNT